MAFRSRGAWLVAALLVAVGVLLWRMGGDTATPSETPVAQGDQGAVAGSGTGAVAKNPTSAGIAQVNPSPSGMTSGSRQAPDPDETPMARHMRLLGIEPEGTLILKDAMTGPNGDRHYRYEQAYRGVPVANHNFVVHESGQGALSVSGNAITGIAAQVPTTSPRLSQAEAISIATRHVAAEHAGKLQIDTTSATLAIQRDDAGRLHLAYMVTIDGSVEGEDDPLGEEVAVDALTGEIVAQQRTWSS